MNNYNYMNYDLNHMNNISRKMDALASPKEGFIKGNLFDNLYQGYKNYQPMMLKPKDNKEKLLYELQAVSFAIHELNLYLDIHPNNQSMFMLFQDYLSQKDKLTKEYEEKYGPLMVCSVNGDKSSFKWVEDSWPWEVNNV